MDDAAAAMLAQVLEVEGATVRIGSHADLMARTTVPQQMEGVETVVVTFLNGSSKAHARLVVRRIKRLKADLRVGILIPLANGVDNPRIEPSEIGADFVCQTLPKTIEQALTAAPAVLLQVPLRKASRPRVRLVKTVV